MLPKNAKTGERNVLDLFHLEAENVPDVSVNADIEMHLQ